MTRATPRHPAVKAATELRTWTQRWPDGAPLPAIQMVSAWLTKAAATPKAKAEPKPKPARIPRPSTRKPAAVIAATEVTPAEVEAARPPRKAKAQKPTA